MSAIQSIPTSAEVVPAAVVDTQAVEVAPAVSEQSENEVVDAEGSKIEIDEPIATTSTIQDPISAHPNRTITPASIPAPISGSSLKESTSAPNTTTTVPLQDTTIANEPAAEGVKASSSEPTSVAAVAEGKKEDVKEKKESPKKDKKPGFLSRLMAQFSISGDKVENKVEHKKEKKAVKTDAPATTGSAVADEVPATGAAATTAEPIEIVAPVAMTDETKAVKETHAPVEASTESAPVEAPVETSSAIPASTSEAKVAPEAVEPVASASAIATEVKSEEAPVTPAKTAPSPKMNRRLSARVSDLFKSHIGGPKKEKSASPKKDDVVAVAGGETEGKTVVEEIKAEDGKVSDSAPVLDAPVTNAPIALGEVVPAAENQEEPSMSAAKPITASA